MASLLSDFEITTIKESDWEQAESKDEKLLLSEIPEFSKLMREKLIAAGYETAEEVLDTGRQSLLDLKGFGEKTVDKIFEILNSYYEEEPQEGNIEEKDSE